MHEAQEKLETLLLKHAVTPFGRSILTAQIVAAAFEMGHLYSDLGLPSRARMNQLMQKHYPALALRKPGTLRWKKFLFDEINAIAPACVACGDQNHCFSCELSII